MALIPFPNAFPHDVERIVMEAAAHNDRQTALALALVAKRIQVW